MSKIKNTNVGILLNLGYFECSKLAVEGILSQRNLGKFPVPRELRRLVPNYEADFDATYASLLLASRYNFKHALELSMKSLFQITYKKPPIGHNIESICEKMKKELVDISIFKNTFNAWEWVVNKYSINDPFTSADYHNELDRYLISTDGRVFPYSELNKITRRDLHLFLRDIKTAKDLFLKMWGEKCYIERCKKSKKTPTPSKSSRIVISKQKNGTYITKAKPKIK